jgi:hypothetical protein
MTAVGMGSLIGYPLNGFSSMAMEAAASSPSSMNGRHSKQNPKIVSGEYYSHLPLGNHSSSHRKDRNMTTDSRSVTASRPQQWQQQQQQQQCHSFEEFIANCRHSLASIANVCLENIYGDGAKINYVNVTLDFTTWVPVLRLFRFTIVTGMTSPRTF